MRRLLTHFWNDEHGMIVTAEMVVIGTVGVLATIVGVDLLATSVTLELNDLSNAFLKLNQSYSYTGFRATGGGGGNKFKSSSSGAGYRDSVKSSSLSIETGAIQFNTVQEANRIAVLQIVPTENRLKITVTPQNIQPKAAVAPQVKIQSEFQCLTDDQLQALLKCLSSELTKRRLQPGCNTAPAQQQADELIDKDKDG